MEALVRHLVEPIVQHKGDVSIQVIEKPSVLLMELVVHPDDRERLLGDKAKTLRAIRTILSAAAGKQGVSLDLVEQHAAAGEEE